MTMSPDTLVLKEVEEAFAGCRRPEHFTNYAHCEECAAHDMLLRSRDVQSLRFEDVENPGWDPFCYITPEGFAYYLPALARFTLDKPAESQRWHGARFLFHLCSKGHGKDRVQVCTPKQRAAVVRFLQHLAEVRAGTVAEQGITDELYRAIEIWVKNSGAAAAA